MEELSLQEIHQITLNILKKIDEVVRKLNLKYYMAFGSLIGTVRHHGFIPWDDDLDIMMLRKDYDKFISYFVEHKEELYPYQIFTVNICPNYPHMIARVCHMEYPIEVKNEIPCGMGVFVDLYPLDGMGNDGEQLKRERKRVQRLIEGQVWATRLRFEAPSKKYRIPDKFLKYLYAKWRGKTYFERELTEYTKKYDFENSKYIGVSIWGSWMNYYKKELFAEIEEMPFEDFDVMVPKGYDEILRLIYGDYTKLPPENERKPQHNYRAYRRSGSK